MRKYYIFTVLFCLSLGATAQDASIKERALAEITAMEAKVKEYKAMVLAAEVLNSDQLYEMSNELQPFVNSFAEFAYETEYQSLENIAGGVLEEIQSDGSPTEEMEGDEAYGEGIEESEKEYKGDIKKTMPQKIKENLDDFGMIVGWGINTINGDGPEIPHLLWGSSNWEVGFMHKKRLGSSKARLQYGLSLNTHYFKLDNANITSIDAAPGYVVNATTDFDKVRFGVRYLQIPIGIGFKLGKKGELFLGGHGGLRVKGYTKREYKIPNEEIVAEATSNYGTNKFNYGLNASIGSDKLRVFGKYDLNPLFKEGPAYNILTFGLRVGY